jgi:hypothetical protein
MESVWLLQRLVAIVVRHARLDFLGRPPFRRESPLAGGLDFLGFPWILSSESRLFNGLRGFLRVENFSRPLWWRGGAGTGASGPGMQRIVHGGELSAISDFL